MEDTTTSLVQEGEQENNLLIQTIEEVDPPPPSVPQTKIIRSENYDTELNIGGFRQVWCCVVPNSWSGIICTIILILTPSILQLIFVNCAFNRIAILDTSYCIFCVIVLICLFRTTFTDPGIIPRQTKQQLRLTEQLYKTDQESVQSVEHAQNSSNNEEQQQYVEDWIVLVNGKEVNCPKCRTCHIHRPPRSFHCSQCKACIELHDHHCPWVGTCVGKRNHKFFLAFIIATNLYSATTAAIDIIYMVRKYYDDDGQDSSSQRYNGGQWPVAKLITTAILVYTISIFLCTVGLAGYHGKLAVSGETTNEDVRGKYIAGNIYAKSYKQNCIDFCYPGQSRLEPGYDEEIAAKTDSSIFIPRPKSQVIKQQESVN